MQETPMLFPTAPGEFWKQIKVTIEEAVKANINQTAVQPPTDHLPEKVLLKLTDVCAVFQVSKPTLYNWLRQNKLKSFKIKSRRYFLRTDIETMIRQHEAMPWKYMYNHKGKQGKKKMEDCLEEKLGNK